jgi:hypothetical protein
MVHRQAKLSPDDIESLKKFEASIEHWSTQHTKLAIQADDAKGAVRSIWLARQKLFERVYAEAGIDPAQVNHAELMDDGVLNVLCQDPAPAQEPSPEGQNGSPSPAPAEA